MILKSTALINICLISESHLLEYLIVHIVAATLQESGTTGTSQSYLVFSEEQRATVGRYGATHGNSAAVKKFWDEFDNRLVQ